MTGTTRPSAHCLDLETLAAYLDRTLPPAERAAVETHLAECGHCYELFSEVAQVNAGLANQPAAAAPAAPRKKWPRGVLSGLAAASVLLLAWAGWTIIRPADDVEGRIASLVNGATTERFTRGRLSAARQWAPAPSPARGTAQPELPLDAQQTAISLQQLAVGERTAARMRGAGIGLLAVGKLDASIQALSEAVELDPGSVAAQNDLAAALLDRAATGGDADDAVRALDHAERAVRLDSVSAPAHFNRAMANEAIGNRPRAIEAWREYLKLESDGPWAAEARERLAALEKASWARPPGMADIASITDADLALLARRHRPWLDRALALTLLPAWSAAPQRGATGALSRVARALTASGSETPATTLANAVLSSNRWPGSRRRCLAEAIASLARWKTAVDAGDRPAGLAAAEKASQAIGCAGLDPVLAALPTVWATAAAGRLTDARSLAAAAADRARRAEYWSLEADLCEQLSAIAIQETRLSDATDVRVRGRLAAEKAQDYEAVARFDELLGESADEQGDRSAAWNHFRNAIRALHEHSSPLHRYGTLATVTIAASHTGLSGAAAGFSDQLLEAANGTGRTTYRIMALLQRGRARAALGDKAGAEDVLAAAALLPAIPEERRRAAWGAEVGWITGVVMASSDPGRAVQGLTAAIDYFERAGRRFRLAELFLHRGRLHRALGNTAAARADFMRGAEVLEDQRPAIREEQLRISRTAEVWDLFTELIALHGNDAEASLQVFERAKARELLEALARDREQHALTVTALKACLPHDTMAVSYAALPDKLHVWEITRDQVTVRTHPVPRKQLEKWVAAYQRELMSGTGEDAAGALGRHLLPAQLPRDPAVTLVIVPDGPLARVAFAALPTPRGRLVEVATPLIAPSLTTFCLNSRNSHESPRSASLVGVSQAIADPVLPPLPEIRREITALTKLYADRDVLLDADATAQAVTASWTKHGIVHFAGHAVVNERFPYQSRLFTSPDAAPASLAFAEISSARLRPGALVVLAACQTATGRIFDGEGAMSLARPFLAAGASAVLGSLWNIRDADARQVVERVHSRLAAGDRLDRALAQTQRELIRAAAPLSAWSGYLVTGGIPAWSHRQEP
jgi:CHAT domain-containing protein